MTNTGTPATITITEAVPATELANGFQDFQVNGVTRVRIEWIESVRGTTSYSVFHTNTHTGYSRRFADLGEAFGKAFDLVEAAAEDEERRARQIADAVFA